MFFAVFFFPYIVQWPVGNVVSTILKPDDEEVPKPQASPDLDMIGHLTSVCAAFRSFLLAVACVYWAYPDNSYPGFGEAKELSFSWMYPIIIRDVAATWIICGLWDWFLYFSPLKDKLHKYRIEHVYPPISQVRFSLRWHVGNTTHSRFTLLTSACLSLISDL